MSLRSSSEGTVRERLGRLRTWLGERVAGRPVFTPERESEALAELREAVKDERYEQSREAWLRSHYAQGDPAERPDLPGLFVLVDSEGVAHGPFRADHVVRSPLRGNPWVIASPESPSVFRVVASDGRDRLWTEDDEVLEVVRLVG